MDFSINMRVVQFKQNQSLSKQNQKNITAEQQMFLKKLGKLVEMARKTDPKYMGRFTGNILIHVGSPILAYCHPQEIIVSPDLLERSPRDQVFVMLHELEHLKRDHVALSGKLLDQRPPDCDEEFWENAIAIGFDMEVNAYLRKRLGYVAWGASCPGYRQFKTVPELPNAEAYAKAVVNDKRLVQTVMGLRTYMDPVQEVKPPKTAFRRQPTESAKFSRRGVRSPRRPLRASHPLLGTCRARSGAGS